MAKQTDPNSFIIDDITQLSIDELKKMDLEDILIYINEREDRNEIIIYFFKIIKKIIESTDLNTKLIQYREKYREYTDLEKRLDLIYGIIEQNTLLLDNDLNSIKNDLETKLERLSYTNLREIEGLNTINKKIKYETSLKEYNSLKEEIRIFFGKICTLLINTSQERFKEDRAFQRYMAMYAEARKTPELSTQTWLTNAMDEAYLHNAIDAGMIDQKQADTIREQMIINRTINAQKAKEFYEETKKLKGDHKK